MTSRHSPDRDSTRAGNADAARIAAWLVVILLIPRVLRMLYPEVWVEDDFYLEAAWLMSVGMRPYLDFVHPHMPLLEWIAAGYLKLFGASLKTWGTPSEVENWIEGLSVRVVFRTVPSVWSHRNPVRA